ncbi:MAG: 3-oxoacyl-ACP reductase [Lysinibacillus sp.]
MAKLKGKGVVLAGLIAGVLSFLSKKENRDNTMSYLSQLKKEANSFQKGSANIQQKVNEFFNAAQGTKNTTGAKDEKIASFMAMSPNATEKPQKETLEDIASTAAQAADSVLEGNHMIDEGAQTTVNHYNEQQHQDQQDLR